MGATEVGVPEVVGEVDGGHASGSQGLRRG
jgi:hypothetical protein